MDTKEFAQNNESSKKRKILEIFKIKKLRSIDHYRERITLIYLVLMIFGILYSVTLALLFGNDVLVLDNNNKNPLQSYILTYTLIVLAAIGVIILALCFLGSQQGETKAGDFFSYKNSPKRALILLTISTILLIVFIAIPIFITGGSIKSIYGTQLVTLCAVAVLVTRSNSLRFLIIVFSVLVYILATYINFPSHINNEGYHDVLYIIFIISNIAFAGWIGWKKPGILSEE
jgi:hypothetical protein